MSSELGFSSVETFVAIPLHVAHRSCELAERIVLERIWQRFSRNDVYFVVVG